MKRQYFSFIGHIKKKKKKREKKKTIRVRDLVSVVLFSPFFTVFSVSLAPNCVVREKL